MTFVPAAVFMLSTPTTVVRWNGVYSCVPPPTRYHPILSCKPMLQHHIHNSKWEVSEERLDCRAFDWRGVVIKRDGLSSSPNKGRGQLLLHCVTFSFKVNT
ncbi:hypothetical protein BDV23DRAFT_160173 [Aspergillus alliaceus]|uniref:Uncharacterized protein n=1 Tax=Petromyces alliaceus TaxID=209559 RepID=A0A5N7C1E1_PETAA|nr:hypothetical protein BDV23DRAFT_160173 [Aspergillus alliaceus]